MSSCVRGGWIGALLLACASPGLAATPHPEDVRVVRWSPDGETFLTACDAGQARVWSRDGTSVFEWDLKRGVLEAAWSPDSERVVAVMGRVAPQVWDATNGRLIGPLDAPQSEAPKDYKPGTPAYAESVAYSPDGKLFAVAYRDSTVVAYDAANGKQAGVIRLPKGSYATLLRYSPDGKTLLVAGRSLNAVLFDAARGRPVAKLAGQEPNGPGRFGLTDAEWSADGTKLLTVGDETVSVRSGPKWEEKLVVSDREVTPSTGRVSWNPWQAAWSPDAGRFVIAHTTAPPSVIDAETGKLLGELEASGSGLQLASAMDWSPDGKTIVTGHRDGDVVIWDAETLELRERLDP